ncbi:hypothetical protein GCM10023194_03330 [Planotetraspora phitsanulokensis]|uniref:Uncharacterized protein n=1 Tax=Planotetraspora phitsanulokensis TaxID=575192 RepID=A0A8J3UA47_9ACTN|nr:hypothetical protein [Planotetraspora phitsanulokensis]GII40811.1 hypothetical protein Pph01_58140 [Planotetraspora phitsanulokensis]
MSSTWEKRRDRLESLPANRLWATRPARRRLVAAGAAALVVLWAGLVVIAQYAPSDLARNVYLSMFGVGLVVGLPVISWLHAATRGAMYLPEQYLDERQRTERHRAYTSAHGATTAVLALLFVLANFVSWQQDGPLSITIPLALIGPTALTLAATHYTMPLLIAGWRLPDLPPDDEDEYEDA